MQKFSMNPDPHSWVELESGTLDFDQYPDGSFQFRVTKYDFYKRKQIVTLKSTLPAAIIAAAQVVDAINEMREGYEILLRVQTFPDQRGDKQGKSGACISARVSARMIGTINADEIQVFDLHSKAALTYLRETYEGVVTEVNSLKCFDLMAYREVINSGVHVVKGYNRYDPSFDASDVKVVQVDAGASTRARLWAGFYHADLICMEKARDPEGRIVGHQIVGDPQSLLLPMNPETDVWVIDDLCDGGATFISVAKKLREEFPAWRGKLNLYVTHGLFSKGRVELLQHFDSVYALFNYDDWRSPEAQKAQIGTSDIMASLIGADEADITRGLR